MSDQISDAFYRVAQISEALGVTSIKDLPGCWEHVCGKVRISVNGHKEPVKCSTGAEVPAFHALVEINGWPVALLNPYGGVVMGVTEDQLMAHLDVVLADARRPR